LSVEISASKPGLQLQPDYLLDLETNLTSISPLLLFEPVLWIRILISIGSRRAKMTHKNRKKLINFIF
jgi:hypothetical protein